MLTDGDTIVIPGIVRMAGSPPFMVIKVMPAGIVQVVDDTILDLRERAVHEQGTPQS